MKKGFTLIEILGVMVLLGVLALITVPIVNTLIKNSKESALSETIQTLETAAYNYSTRNALEYSSQTRILKIDKLKETGYIKNEKIINPVTEEELEGCIFYRWDDNYKQYEFDYDEDCKLKEDLSVTITNVDGKFNDLGWANKEFFVKIETNGTSYNYCVSNKKCSPNAKVETSEGSALISTESDNIYVCAYAIYGKIKSEIVCSDLYKLDNTNPTAGTVEFVGEQGENGWYISDVEVVLKDGLDTLSGHKSTTVNKSQITESTANEKIVVTTTDNADNIATREYTVKMDKTDPTVSISKSVVNNKNVLTATTNTITSGVTYEWYKDGKVITEATSSSYTTTEAGTYKVVATTGAGVSATSNEITIASYSITYNVNGGTCTVANQTKVQDISITLATLASNCRSGYEFLGWGTSASDTTVDYAAGATYTENSEKNLYAIWRKTVTITFYKNGAASITPKGGSASTASSLTQTCYMYNAETSCSITSPTISASTATPTVLGWGTSASATSNSWSVNTAKSFSSNASYYAVTKKDAVTYTATFNKNNATLVDTGNTDSATKDSCTIAATYNGTAQATSCQVHSPNITAPSATPTVLGFNTSASATSSKWNVNTAKNISSNVIYYAITRKDAVTYTATFNGNGATITKASAQCTIAATYNGAAQGTSCSITAPKITRSGYTIVGFNTSASATSASVGSEKTFSISSNPTYYAVTSKTLTLSYNANSGSGTTNSQTCTVYNTGTSCNITINSTGYSKSGYTFLGYYTNGYKDSPMSYYADAYADVKNAYGYDSTSLYNHYILAGKTEGRSISEYVPSGKITLTANTTLYAGWAKGITVSYNGNGATSGSTSSQTCYVFNSGTTCSITLNNNGYAKSNYTFQRWEDGSKTYYPSTTYNFSNNITLYAIWKANYICSSGTLVQNTSYSSATGGWICVANNPTSSQQCTATACNTCTYSTTEYGPGDTCPNKTCDVATAGARWCTEYTYGVIYTGQYSSTNDAEAACRGNGSCTYTNCWESPSKTICSTSTCRSNCKGTLTTEDGTTYCVIPGYTCQLLKPDGCAKTGGCVPLSTFTNHREGIDYVNDGCTAYENKQDSSCGKESCYYQATKTDANCSQCGSYCSSSTTVYSCPSGWSTYNGSGSGLNCYVSATLAQ